MTTITTDETRQLKQELEATRKKLAIAEDRIGLLKRETFRALEQMSKFCQFRWRLEPTRQELATEFEGIARNLRGIYAISELPV